MDAPSVDANPELPAQRSPASALIADILGKKSALRGER
jgi:hypothetical protein